jgi:hypothetical protein
MAPRFSFFLITKEIQNGQRRPPHEARQDLARNVWKESAEEEDDSAEQSKSRFQRRAPAVV